MKTILIIGCGSIGERHIRCFQKTGSFEVIACDTDTEVLSRISKKYSVAICTDWEELLQNGGVDAALIATPAHYHIPMATKALEAGKHVLIEKPLSISQEGIKDLIRIRDETNLQALVAYTYRSMPVSIEMRNWMKGKRIGTPLTVHVSTGQHFPTFRPAYREIYYNDHSTGGGAIQDGLTHLINTVEWLVGPLDSVYCDADHLALERVNVEDTVNLLGRSKGTLCNFAFNHFQAPNENTLTIHSDTGSIRGEYHKNRVGFINRNETHWTWKQLPDHDRDAFYVAQAKAFLKAMNGEETVLSTLEEAEQTLRVNLAALESAKTGQKIILNNSTL